MTKVIKILHEDPNRATGKTFRLLCQAMGQASAGHKVFYVCGSNKISDWTKNQCLRMVGSHLNLENDSKATINFPTGGFIHFITNSYKDRDFQYRLRGYKKSEIKTIWDIVYD